MTKAVFLSEGGNTYITPSRTEEPGDNDLIRVVYSSGFNIRDSEDSRDVIKVMSEKYYVPSMPNIIPGYYPKIYLSANDNSYTELTDGELTIGEDTSTAHVGCTLNGYSIVFNDYNISISAPYGNHTDSEIIFKHLPTSDPKNKG